MTQKRLNALAVAPDGYKALTGVETYLENCGLDQRLITLVKTRVSQINGCAYCLHMHTEHARKLGKSDMRLHLLDAWRKVQSLFTTGTRGPGLGGIADEYRGYARARRRLRGSAEQVFRERTRGSVDSDRHDQRMDPPGHWLESRPSCRRRQGGVKRFRKAVVGLIGNSGSDQRALKRARLSFASRSTDVRVSGNAVLITGVGAAFFREARRPGGPSSISTSGS